MSASIMSDICSIIILFLPLMPYFLTGKPSGHINHRKQNFLLYASLLHFFTLCLRLTGFLINASLPETGSGNLFITAAVVPSLFSAILLGLCILCSENGDLRIPKGAEIPVNQIICAVLPPVLALCLEIIFPDLSLFDLGWSVALHLVQNCITADSEKQIKKTEQRLDRGQAALMTLQMRPHFIFNTLSAIAALCRTDPQSAAETIENLSGYLRANIDVLSGEERIPFDEELRHIRQYIALEQADPARKFRFDYELDIRSFTLPPLTVQPIVENAVKHGALTCPNGTGRVLLTTETLGDYVRITVLDNGTGTGDLTELQKKSRGIGIENTRKRLEVLCGGSLQITEGKDGTKAVILIPAKEAEG